MQRMSLLWKGALTNSALRSELPKNLFLFESCRSAIYDYALFQKKIFGLKVVHATSYTCDAVIDALKLAGVEIRYYELDQNFSVNLETIKKNTNCPNEEWILWQCTLGHFGGDISLINDLRQKGYKVVGDLALSFGSTYHDKGFENYFDASFISFECSKLLSAGWGGGLFLNCIKYDRHYQKLKSISMIESFLRYFQEKFCSHYHNRFGIDTIGFRFYDLFRKFLTLIGIFRRSSDSSKCRSIGHRIGRFQFKLILGLLSELEISRRKDISSAFFKIYSLAKNNAVLTPLLSESTKACAPRFPFFVKLSNAEITKQIAKTCDLSLGDWFDSNQDFKSLTFKINDFEYICYNISTFNQTKDSLLKLELFFKEIAGMN